MTDCKTCSSCRASKPVIEFNRSRGRKDGRHPYCRACLSARHRGENPRQPDPNRIEPEPGEKVCARCRTSKPLAAFPVGTKWQDGLFPYCRECKRASDRESHARHKPVRNAAMRAHYQAKKAAYIARATAQYVADRDAGKRRAREWALANPERRMQIRKESARRRWAADPERFREAWRKRQAAVRRGCRVYGFTPEQIAVKVTYWGHRCWVCLGPYDSIDHVKPLAKRGPHMLANLRPICTPCNSRKLDQWPFPAHSSVSTQGAQRSSSGDSSHA